MTSSYLLQPLRTYQEARASMDDYRFDFMEGYDADPAERNPYLLPCTCADAFAFGRYCRANDIAAPFHVRDLVKGTGPVWYLRRARYRVEGDTVECLP